MEKYPICPECINVSKTEELCDEVWCIRDAKTYPRVLCKEHQHLDIFMSIKKALFKTKELYEQLPPRESEIICSCAENFMSKANCRTHGISTQLDRTQME